MTPGETPTEEQPAWQRAARAILDGHTARRAAPAGSAYGPGPTVRDPRPHRTPSDRDAGPSEEPRTSDTDPGVRTAAPGGVPGTDRPEIILPGTAPRPSTALATLPAGAGDPTPPRPARALRGAIAVGLGVVAVLTVGWLSRGDSMGAGLANPSGNGVTVPTDSDGRPVDLPPSQPAIAVSFAPSGEVVRPDPSRGRVVDPATGQDVVIPLLPGSGIDATSGQVVVRPPATSGSTGTTATTRPESTTPSTAPTTTDTTPDTTEPPTTDTTSDTTAPTDPPPTDGGLGALIGGLLP
ncbi:MAG TPA: hypothetical protein VFI47_08975 [Acidimicrobiales bacterium]|nr:hypothetical protein [Acidimicrobiales bacterium]